MQNLFISPDDEFIVKFTVAVHKNEDTIFCDIGEESLITSLKDLGRDVDDYTIKEYQATFKKPSFGDSSELYGTILMSDEGVSFNPIEVRFRKISALIKSWDLKGKEEKPTKEDILKLHPVIAAALGTLVDLEIGSIFS